MKINLGHCACDALFFIEFYKYEKTIAALLKEVQRENA